MVIAYLIIAIIAWGFIDNAWPKGTDSWDESERGFKILICAIFWPVVFLFYIGVFISELTER